MNYYITLTIIFLLFTPIFNFWFNKVEDQRVSDLENKKNMGSVRPRISKLREVLKKTKLKAIKNVGTRFTIIKRLSFILWILLFIFLIFFPTFTKASKTTISLLISASTVLLGIASKQLIENIISGVVITFSKQFNIGDTVMIGEMYGMVEDITMTHSVIKVWDSKRYVVPNSEMLREKFINYTLIESTQWATVEFWVSYDEDLEAIKELAVDIADNSKFKKKNEHPSYFWIMEMGEKGIKCWISALVDSPANGWDFKADVRTKLCLKFCELKIKPHLNYTNLKGQDIGIDPKIV
jgi:small-conductance mechanosensitive channel